MIIGAVTGGRDHWPTLAELEQLAVEMKARGVTDLRHGDCPTGLDRIARGYVRARHLAEVEKHPGDWKTHGKAAGHIRNGTMLDGTTPMVKAKTAGQRAEVLFAFAGGRGTANCRDQAIKRGIEVVDIAPVDEPKPWNRHHGKPAGPSVYVGRGSPLGNPYPVELHPGETRVEAAPRILGLYREWLWLRIRRGPEHDPAVVGALEQITPEHYLICSCWPAHCHAEMIIRAWRWLRGTRSRSPLAQATRPKTHIKEA